MAKSEHSVTGVRTRGRLFGVVLRPFQIFLQQEAASGVLLLIAAALALLWANVDFASYARVIGYPLAVGAGGPVAHFTVAELVNDGLMTLFFFVVGMEI